jgi:ribosome-binding factor A
MKRVSESVKSALARIIDQKLNNPKIPPFVTVLSVKVAKDLRVAEVNVTFLEDQGEDETQAAMEELRKAAGFIRRELGREVRMKYLPELRFHYNPSTAYATELETYFHENPTEPPNEERGGGEAS